MKIMQIKAKKLKNLCELQREKKTVLKQKKLDYEDEFINFSILF